MDVTNMTTEPFAYELQTDLLSAEDIRSMLAEDPRLSAPLWEESLLPTWPAPNWLVEGNSIRQIRSRSQEKEIRRKRILAATGKIDPFVLIQNPPISILAFGYWLWKDYELHARFSGGIDGSTGIAFRYQDGRHYYAVTVEKGVGLRLVLRKEDEIVVLGAREIENESTEYRVVIRAMDDTLTVRLEDGTTITVTDSTYPRGKAAFVCEGESTFGPARASGQKLQDANFPLPEAPEMKLLAEGGLEQPTGSGRIVLVDLDNDGMPELISLNDDGNEVYSQHLVNGHMWRLGPFEHPLSRGGGHPLQAFDIDGDGNNELVFTADFTIRVHDAISGEHRATTETPTANPYRDNRDYPHERMLGDALFPVTTDTNKPKGFYIKDRYWNIWVYDCELNLMWHQALNTGHSPLPFQLVEGEPDYIFASRSLLSPAGEVVWDLGLPDHSDAIGFLALDTEPMLYVAAGEEGLLQIEPKTGKVARQLKWGHVQHYSLGKFDGERRGYQFLASTLWREPGITFLLDEQLNLINRWVEMSYDTVNIPIPWGSSGTDLVVDRTGIRDPFTGRRIRTFPENCGNIRELTVLDLPRYGAGSLFTVNEESWQIWGPGENVPPISPRNRPNALNPAGYLPGLAL